jgi:hypothetical protein
MPSSRSGRPESAAGAPSSDPVRRARGSVAGLSVAEARTRLTRDGPNALPPAAPSPFWCILWSQLSSIITLLLLAGVARLTCAIVSLATMGKNGPVPSARSQSSECVAQAISNRVIIPMSSWSRIWQCTRIGPPVKSVYFVRTVSVPNRGTMAVSL